VATLNAFREEPIGQVDLIREVARRRSRRWPRSENESKDSNKEHDESAHNEPPYGRPTPGNAEHRPVTYA
jgi:hypothetical protein